MNSSKGAVSKRRVGLSSAHDPLGAARAGDSLRAVRERGIIMSGQNPALILDGRKTQTRRIVKPQPIPISFAWEWVKKAVRLQWGEKAQAAALLKYCPYGVAGDRLWVRETLRYSWVRERWEYASDNAPLKSQAKASHATKRDYVPSIHMPRWASRITLEITKVRVERLQDIGEEDAKAEGIEGRWHPDDPECWTWKDYRRSALFHENMYSYGIAVTPITVYAGLWDSLHGKGAWEKNPWVWVVEFKRI